MLLWRPDLDLFQIEFQLEVKALRNLQIHWLHA